MIETDRARLLELAIEGQQRIHAEWQGYRCHFGAFESCAESDCQLVREETAKRKRSTAGTPTLQEATVMKVWMFYRTDGDSGYYRIKLFRSKAKALRWLEQHGEGYGRIEEIEVFE